MTTNVPVLGLEPAIATADAAASWSAGLFPRQAPRPAVKTVARWTGHEIVGSIRVYAARARRRTFPLTTICLEVLDPNGGPAVEMFFGEP